MGHPLNLLLGHRSPPVAEGPEETVSAGGYDDLLQRKGSGAEVNRDPGDFAPGDPDPHSAVRKKPEGLHHNAVPARGEADLEGSVGAGEELHRFRCRGGGVHFFLRPRNDHPCVLDSPTIPTGEDATLEDPKALLLEDDVSRIPGRILVSLLPQNVVGYHRGGRESQ